MQQPNDVMARFYQLARAKFPVPEINDKVRAVLCLSSNGYTLDRLETANRIHPVNLGRRCGILSKGKAAFFDQTERV